MSRWIIASFLAFVLAFLHLQVSYACSFGEDFDPVAQSDLIVGGRIVSWRPLTANPKANDLLPIEVTLSVDKTYKGNLQGNITFIDTASRQAISATEAIWVGGAGPCGAFSEDPTNSYVILGLARQADGTYHSDLPRTFFRGAKAQGQEYELAVKRLAIQPMQLPATGVAQGASSVEPYHTLLLLGFSLAITCLGGVLRLQKEQ